MKLNNNERLFKRMLDEQYKITNIKKIGSRHFHDFFQGYHVDLHLKLFIKTDKTEACLAKREAEILQLPSFKSCNYFPNLVANETTGLTPFIAVEWIEGVTLDQVMTKKSFLNSFTEKQSFIDQLIEILSMLQKERIVHRDIRPANLMITLRNDHSFEKITLIDFAFSVGIERFPELAILNQNKSILRGLGTRQYKPSDYRWDNYYSVKKIIKKVNKGFDIHFPKQWSNLNTFKDELFYEIKES